MGTGTRDMIRRCHEAGLPEPVFALSDGFVITLRRRAGQVAGEVTPPVAPPVAPPVVIMVRLLGKLGELGNAEIRQHLGLRDRTHLRERYLDPCLNEGWVEMTIPDKPNSRLQKYRLTAKGAALLATIPDGNLPA